MTMNAKTAQAHVAVTAFLALFAIVGVAQYGLPFFYDHMIREFGWTRQQVTSGNAYSKLLIGPLFGFLAGWIVDRFGPKRLMLAGIVFFSGSIYLMTAGAPRWLGMVAPVGGVSFMAAWALLAWHAYSVRQDSGGT